MFKSGCNYNKLKTNLQLAVQRLKLLEKKKTELAKKSRPEIVSYLTANKPERARIRVETIIREENTVEAMEMLEMYCDLLIARFGLLKAQANDTGLDEAVCSLIWAAPRMEAEIQEFKVIAEQLRYKYGRDYFEAASSNSVNKVNSTLMKKMGVKPPEKRIVELYLVEIAKSFNVPYTPDPSAFSVPAAPLLSDFATSGEPPAPGFVYPSDASSMAPLEPSSSQEPDQPRPMQPGQSGGQNEPPQEKTPENAFPPGFFPNSYPGSASAPVHYTLPPPYQADSKPYPPGWTNSEEKAPLPNDPVNPPSNFYPHNDDIASGGSVQPDMPSVPSGQADNLAPSSDQSFSQTPGDASLDDLEKRFEDLRRKK